MKAIGVGVGIPFGRSRGWTPQISDLNFWGKGRSGLTIPDTLGNNAAILPKCEIVGNVGATNQPSLVVANFGNVSSGFIEAKVYIDKADTYYYIWSSARRSFQSGVNYKYFSIAILSSRPTIRVRDDSAAYENIIQAPAVASNGWYTIRFASDGSAYSISVNGTNQALDVSGSGGSDNGNWLADVANRENIYVGLVYSYNAINSQDFKIAYINFNDTNKWVFTGQKYVYDIIGTTHLTSSVVTPSFDSGGSSELLDNGYSLWTKAGAVDEYVPYKNGSPYDVSSFLVGYTKQRDYAGSLTTHNLAPSLIDFDHANANPAALAVLDRSSVTYQSAVSRAASDYNAAEVFQYNIANIADPRIWTTFFNEGHAGKAYQKITTELISGSYYPKSIEELILLKTDKTGAAQLKVMEYCGTDVFAI